MDSQQSDDGELHRRGQSELWQGGQTRVISVGELARMGLVVTGSHEVVNNRVSGTGGHEVVSRRVSVTGGYEVVNNRVSVTEGNQVVNNRVSVSGGGHEVFSNRVTVTGGHEVVNNRVSVLTSSDNTTHTVMTSEEDTARQTDKSIVSPHDLSRQSEGDLENSPDSKQTIVQHLDRENNPKHQSLQDSRLVGVPTMGRVIQISDLSTLAIPEMKIVLQSDTKMDDLSHLPRLLEQPSHPQKNLPEIEDKDDRHLFMHYQPQPEGPQLIELVGQSIPHSMEIKPKSPLVSEDSEINRVADRSFPGVVIEEILLEYRTAARYDAIWKCEGGRYKVHRFVLALASPYLNQLLAGHLDEVKPVIYTPDFSSDCVKAILCLFYTGKVNVARDIMGEVNVALKLLHFNGDNVTVLPNQGIKQEIIPDYGVGDLCEVEIHKVKPGKRNNLKEEEEDSDEDWNIETAFETDIQGEEEVSEDDWWDPKPAPKKRKLSSVKNERWWSEDEDDKASYTGFKRGRKSLKSPDTHEVFRTRGPGKGERSFQLALDLFQGKHVDFIYVCHACYSIYDTYKKLAVHKDDVHPDNPDKFGAHHTSSINMYNCPKCSQIISVKHIAWFCKHLQFCRENNEIANDLVGPDDIISDTDENHQIVVKKKHKKIGSGSDINNGLVLKDTDERLRITGDAKGRNVQTLSKLLVSRVVDYIWACKLCYSVFLTEDDLKNHKKTDHSESEEFGRFWNVTTENYTCPFCHQIQNSRHLVWFIYHMRKCNMVNITLPLDVKKEVNEEDDSEDEEEMEGDEIDPEQIVLKTLNVKGDRAEWLCEALLGKIVERLYPCHICYSLFDKISELRTHFRGSHGDIVNSVRNGPYFDNENILFNCPVCQKAVCRKQTNSTFFIYHFRRCSGQIFTLRKSCTECGKEFTTFPEYKCHVDSHKLNSNFMCHICTKVFPSNARLNYHVQYVHSSYKPFQCNKCNKSYKRKAELLEHEEMSHSTHFNYSCDKCGKQFYGKKNLALHMKTHYTEDEKKHVCNICGYRFAKIKFLKNHLTTHSDVRQFACEICGARVKTRDTLKQHRKKLHNLLTPVPKIAGAEHIDSGIVVSDVVTVGLEHKIIGTIIPKL